MTSPPDNGFPLQALGLSLEALGNPLSLVMSRLCRGFHVFPILSLVNFLGLPGLKPGMHESSLFISKPVGVLGHTSDGS